MDTPDAHRPALPAPASAPRAADAAPAGTAPASAPHPAALLPLLTLVAELEAAARTEGAAVAHPLEGGGLRTVSGRTDLARADLARALARTVATPTSTPAPGELHADAGTKPARTARTARPLPAVVPAPLPTLAELCERMLTLETAARAQGGAAPHGASAADLDAEVVAARAAFMADLARVCASPSQEVHA